MLAFVLGCGESDYGNSGCTTAETCGVGAVCSSSGCTDDPDASQICDQDAGGCGASAYCSLDECSDYAAPGEACGLFEWPCPPGYACVGDPAYCRVPGAAGEFCNHDSECRSQECLNLRCTGESSSIVCATDRDCGAPAMVCRQGYCMTPDCRLSGCAACRQLDVGEPYTCVGPGGLGDDGDACATTADCAERLYCDPLLGQCRPLGVLSERCHTEVYSCLAGLVCRVSKGDAGARCLPPSNDGDPCLRNGTCASYECHPEACVCLGGDSSTECRDDGESCGVARVCVDGVCTFMRYPGTPCTNHVDCAGQHVCVPRVCDDGDVDCIEPHGECDVPQSNDAPCFDDRGCDPHHRCEPVAESFAGVCLRLPELGDRCQPESGCAAQLRCVVAGGDGRCEHIVAHGECSSDGECPDDTVCRGPAGGRQCLYGLGQWGDLCGATDECGGALSCQSGRCFPPLVGIGEPCVSADDCPATLVCAAGCATCPSECQPPAPAGEFCEFHGACGAGLECVGSVCSVPQ